MKKEMKFIPGDYVYLIFLHPKNSGRFEAFRVRIILKLLARLQGFPLSMFMVERWGGKEDRELLIRETSINFF